MYSEGFYNFLTSDINNAILSMRKIVSLLRSMDYKNYHIGDVVYNSNETIVLIINNITGEEIYKNINITIQKNDEYDLYFSKYRSYEDRDKVEEYFSSKEFQRIIKLSNIISK